MQQYRKDFPMLRQKVNGNPLIYLDSAATALKPQTVIDTVTDYYSHSYGTVHRAVYSLSVKATEAYNKVRSCIKNFINAKKDEEIIFTKGTTESINLLAYSFSDAFIKDGDEIILSELEHHSNIIPWQLLQDRKHVTLKVIPVNDKGELLLDEYKKLLTDKVALVSIAHISNSIGTVHPIKEMIRMAHRAGAHVIIDGAQGAAHSVVDVQDLDADFYVFSGHKLMGPTGTGILYGKEKLLEKMPPFHGGGDMVESVSFNKTTYAHLPMKFEAGTPNIAGILGLGSAIAYLTNIGLSPISDWEQELLLYATKKMVAIEGLRIIGQASNKVGIISFVVDGTHPLDLGTLLDLKGIAMRTGHHCAQPTMQRYHVSTTARISFSLFNTKQEVDQFIDELLKVLTVLK